METTYAKIKDGVVDQIEVVTDEFVTDNPDRYKDHVKTTGEVGRGYTYNDGVFSPPETEEV